MSIEQHPGPHPEREPTPAPAPVPTPAPADAGAALARLLHGLTTAVLALPTEVPRADEDPGSADPDETPASPVHERRTGSLLSELSFLDD
ncbi:hypothetical protein [uncultured Nocardioides sp.]|jgi:hypothetical protein|uniref:hypothetical protein n=1 Tax=uncultured Nocardioides sp. TaxID=198441 RepID=UPI002637EE58|nr:hypothetical protein [uncultured Nocardioides sp.]